MRGSPEKQCSCACADTAQNREQFIKYLAYTDLILYPPSNENENTVVFSISIELSSSFLICCQVGALQICSKGGKQVVVHCDRGTLSTCSRTTGQQQDMLYIPSTVKTLLVVQTLHIVYRQRSVCLQGLGRKRMQRKICTGQIFFVCQRYFYWMGWFPRPCS